ncbi:oligoendopeptidase F [bacterium]|nr:oligoendopeptidase F [bacterium]
MWIERRALFAEAEEAGGSPLERDRIEARLKWRPGLIYPGWPAWDADFAAIEGLLPALAARQGTLADSGAALLGAIEATHDARRRLERLLIYANLRSDEDTRIGDHTARKGRAASLSVRYAEAVSWFESEVLEIEPARLGELVAAEPGLAGYAHFFDNIHRGRAHTLPAEQEALLAGAGLMARGAGQVFNAFDNADLRLGEVVDEQGRRVTLTKARHQKFMKSTDRRLRRESYEIFLDAYGAMQNTLAANLDANIKNHVFYAQARRHPGALEAALHPDCVAPSVFHALVESVGAHAEVIHRYTSLKKRVLGLDPLREHDLAAPLFPDGEFSFDYDEACAMGLEALAPLGPEYVATVRGGIEGGWIDVHENAGKRSGGYSSGSYDTPPFILLNWSDQLGDTFTLAHELGHSLHTWLAARHQPYVYGDYPIFTAEVASTFNELLTMDHLLRTTTDPRRRLYLLDYQLSQINNTVFRQMWCAEFELRIHQAGEQGETLTAPWLNALYLELLRKYWGPEVEFDPARSPLTWSRIPHFFYNFYVYQYATAYSAAVALSRKVQDGGVAEREQYLDILRSGCSRYPVETVRLGGVDLASPGPMRDVIVLFGRLVDQVESLLES